MKGSSRHLAIFFVSLVIYLPTLASDSSFAFRSKVVYQTKTTGIFDNVKWSTRLDGPIRSSISTDGKILYAATTKGTIYALEHEKGSVKWKFNTSAINSTPAVDHSKVYFTNNDQTLICLDSRTGQQKWKTSLGNSLPYEWGFDNYFSSPVISGSSIYAGSHDGHLYSLNKENGKINWKFYAGAIIRSTPMIDNNRIYFGDVNGYVYCVNASNGKLVWKSATRGTMFDNKKFGFDRRAIIGSAAFSEKYCIIGSRDGGLYAFNKITGDTAWHFSYGTSWVISTPVIKDDMVISATSDGKFINAININTGREIWKCNTKQIVWSSPIIVNNIVYTGDNEGIFYAIDLYTGKKLSEVRTNGGIMSSPVFSNASILFANDEGRVFNISHTISKASARTKYVYWQRQPAGIYFRNNIDEKVKNYLVDNGYVLADTTRLKEILETDPSGSSIVFVNGVIPDKLLSGGKTSPFRTYLDGGGRMTFTNLNPVLFDLFNPSLSLGLNAGRVKDILGLDYGADDLRSAKGVFASFSTVAGKKNLLPDFWLAGFALDTLQVDEVWGLDERGKASSWKKNYRSGGSISQVWLDPAREENYRFLLHVSQ